MIDLSTEKLLTLRQASSHVPSTPSLSTLHRWRHGIRGVKLETCLIGGKRYTSVEALQRFIVATTAARDGKTASASLLDGDKEASRQLDHLGI